MALKNIIIIFLSSTFIWSLLGVFTLSNGGDSDISCLKSIKESLKDPFNRFKSSWNFSEIGEGFYCGFNGVDCLPGEYKVQSIRLYNKSLKGQFPQGIENCKDLIVLNLSFNKLSGAIPSDISTRLPYLTSLDLSRNNFSGEIPTDIANCTYLNSLKLDHNRLTGQIPQQLGQLTRIKNFTVANNFLSGPVPNFTDPNVTKESYVNNSGLCGGPLEPCKELGRKSDETFKSGFIVGYAASSVSVVTIFVSYCVPWEQMKKRKRMTLKKNSKRKETHR
ncbi:probably inactive leucine-rich repeat receptor-like protein kinase At5g48380 [Quercus robur]|uniref:probably inactive leucine-rich repeat receptor-like protein kinase At5g48380 n=1 Tax=Quercus robur TaxID=38942 RepID=UPI002161AAD0|nr:probably inactive leucine-rich repeat receptor-like protein kinase At5g48380 [Quercus robur]